MSNRKTPLVGKSVGVCRPLYTALCLLITAFCLLLAGCGIPSFLVTPVENSSALEEHVVKEGKGWGAPKIAIIEVEGTLANVKGGGLLQPTENPLSRFVQELDYASCDERVKAVVLRVNSPGGTVTTSDTMYEAIRKFSQKTHKPVVASAQEVMASGAYYASLAADKIVVQPTSLVGSIGVIFTSFDASGAMSKLGLRAEAIKSGPLKDMGSPFKPLTDPERAVMQGMVDEYYARFVSLVGSRRGIKDVQTMTLVTDGRVFSGRRAVELGLADSAGSLEDAIDLAKQLGNAPNAKVIMYRRPYGYGGSIYADSTTPPARANVITFDLPPTRAMLPAGFYYLWEP